MNYFPVRVRAREFGLARRICKYGQDFQQSMDQPGVVAGPSIKLIPGSGHLKKRKGEKMTLFLSSFAPEKVVSRDRSGGPVPRQPAAHSPHSRLNVVLAYGNTPHTVLLVRRANCPCCSRITCLRTGELCNSFLWLRRLQKTTYCCCISYYRLTLLLYYLRCTVGFKRKSERI